MVVTGGWPAKNSATARPHSAQRPRLVTNTRVRTTHERSASSSCTARWFLPTSEYGRQSTSRSHLSQFLPNSLTFDRVTRISSEMSFSDAGSLFSCSLSISNSVLR